MSNMMNSTFVNSSATLLNNMLEEAISSTHATFLQCTNDPSKVAELPLDCLNYTSEDYDYNDESMQLQQVVRLVVPTFFGIIGLSGLLGNALVVLGESFLFVLL